MNVGDLIAPAAAISFAVATGMNDGAPLVAVGSQSWRIRPAWALGILVAALVTVPVILGQRVVETLAFNLVDFGTGSRGLAAGALVVAIIVTASLSARGLPTSLVVALVGSIVGTGWGSGLSVSWAVVGTVSVLTFVAPILAAMVANAIHRLGTTMRRNRIGHLQWSGFVALAAGYAANGGQKMLAAFVLVGTAGPASTLRNSGGQHFHLALVAGAFAVGAVLSVRRMSKTMGDGVRAGRPYDVAVTEWGAAATVFGAASVGIPVSMTQSLAGAAVGTGIRHGASGVRWPLVMRLVVVWVITLPATLTLGGIYGRFA